MEPEGSLPHSQASATCPYPGPAHSSPHTHIPPLEIHPNIIHPSKSRFTHWSLSLLVGKPGKCQQRMINVNLIYVIENYINRTELLFVSEITVFLLNKPEPL